MKSLATRVGVGVQLNAPVDKAQGYFALLQKAVRLFEESIKSWIC
jgi:hypothetical protein